VKIPKALGAVADLLYTTRAKRLALSKQVEALEKDETALREHIIQTLPKSKASGVSGKVARVTVLTDDVPQVEDWDAFYKYVKKNDAFELLQRRLSKEAVAERIDDGETLPGVKLMKIPKVSLNKL
jgi:hypothetical protein